MEKPISPLKLILRTFGYLLISLIGAYFLSWAVSESFFAASDLNYRFNSRRYAQVLNYLESQGRNQKFHLVIGASEVETGFHPDLFDAEFRKNQAVGDFTSLNLGFRGMSPLIFKKLCDRLVEMSAKTGQHYKLISVSFVADRHTVKAQKTFFSKLFDRDIFAEVNSYSMLKKDFQETPGDVLQVGLDKFFFHSQKDAAVLTISQVLLSQIGIKIFRRFQMAQMPSTAVFVTLWYSRLLNFDPAWSTASQGFNTWGEPQTTPYLKAVLDTYRHTPAINENLLKRFQEQFGIQDLEFSDEYLDLTSEGLKSLKAISDRVELINIPLSPEMPKSPGAKGRLKEALQKIGRASEVDVLDYDKIPFEDDDFIDILHLSAKGSQKFSTAFAADVRSYLDSKNEGK